MVVNKKTTWGYRMSMFSTLIIPIEINAIVDGDIIWTSCENSMFKKIKADKLYRFENEKPIYNILNTLTLKRLNMPDIIEDVRLAISKRYKNIKYIYYNETDGDFTQLGYIKIIHNNKILSPEDWTIKFYNPISDNSEIEITLRDIQTMWLYNPSELGIFDYSING